MNILNKNNFILFINKNFYLTECEKKTIINNFNNKYKFYVEQNSNKQIITYYKEAKDKNDIEEIIRLQMLFKHFIPYTLSEKVIEYLNNKKKVNDTDIIQYLLKNVKSEKQNDKVNNKNKFVCDKWVYAIQFMTLVYNNLTRLKRNNENIKFIDICCGTGKKTSIFSKSLNLIKDNVYCTDIETWGPYKNKTKNKIPFQFKYIIDGKLDYENNYFDLLTCMLSLHHINDLEDFIKEIYRITKPGGYFLLIEHSVNNDFDILFINIQHMLYNVFYDNVENYIENPSYTKCYGMYEWNYIMYKNNFYLKKQGVLPFGEEFTNKYDNICYSFYQKKY
jgi:ubiquinone/menaquinone biosynthesis C-methylase UbiE